jgi:hypothetical protein
MRPDFDFRQGELCLRFHVVDFVSLVLLSFRSFCFHSPDVACVSLILLSLHFFSLSFPCVLQSCPCVLLSFHFFCFHFTFFAFVVLFVSFRFTFLVLFRSFSVHFSFRFSVVCFRFTLFAFNSFILLWFGCVCFGFSANMSDGGKGTDAARGGHVSGGECQHRLRL